MPRHFIKSLDSPDELLELNRIRAQVVEMGDSTVSWQVIQPGWRWSTDIRPIVGGEWCQTRHVGIVLSGRMRAMLEDGTMIEAGPREAYVIPPGHDGWVAGDEPIIAIEWSGNRNWIPSMDSLSERVLATILFTDIVDSTAALLRFGDVAWRELLAQNNERVRETLAHYRGREIKTTGDGFLATFDGAARAVRCAAAIRGIAEANGLALRAGIHTGEVELVSDDVRGLAVHEAARIAAAAGPGEILVSSTTRDLSAGAGLVFEDRGEHLLKGLDGSRRLYAVAAHAAGP